MLCTTIQPLFINLVDVSLFYMCVCDVYNFTTIVSWMGFDRLFGSSLIWISFVLFVVVESLVCR